MAEGHAVIRWARALQALVGEPLIEVRLPRRWDARVAALVGTEVRAIETRGKHLLLHLSNTETIHTHAMQYGSWQVGERGMTLRKEARYVRLRLATEQDEAVFYHGPVIELLTAAELAAHEALQALGPDVMAVPVDCAEIARRVAAAADRPIGDVVLDQRVMAGVGNIFKSEGLFLAQIDPRRPASTIDRAEVERFVNEVAPLMWRATERYGKTVTTPPELQEQGLLHYVYRRRGHPCVVCGTKIAMLRQGELERSTYFCPRCQGEGEQRAENREQRGTEEQGNKETREHKNREQRAEGYGGTRKQTNREAGSKRAEGREPRTRALIPDPRPPIPDT